MQYNPANLIYSETGSLSYFVNPMEREYSRVPLVSKSLSMKVNSIVAAGLEYVDCRGGYPSFGDFCPWDYQSYQQTIAGTVALALGADLAVGAQARYAWSSLFDDRTSSNVLFGAGVSYSPQALSQRLTLGLSLMNVGSRVEFIPPEPGGYAGYYGPMPAQFNLAGDYAVVRQPYYDISVDLGLSQLLVEPDVTTHAGFGIQWRPIPLGGGISYFQELSLGYFTSGSSYTRRAFFTHGARAGLDVCGVKAAIGYAGRWHIDPAGAYSFWRYPWETFQLTLSTDWNSPEQFKVSRAHSKDGLKGILLSGGVAYCSAIDQSPEGAFCDDRNSFKHQALWSAEADFYVSDKSALTTSLGYSLLKREAFYVFRDWGITNWTMLDRTTDRLETISCESGFRLHSSEKLNSLFIQASLGIVWFNQMSGDIKPQSAYEPFASMGGGWCIPLNDAGLTLMPKLGLRTVVMGRHGNIRDDLKAFPQFTIGMNIGYML
ncbi:MAG TPA: hypothetical protein VK470_20375 [Bacteroidota bacterium]|nr:hypothetical protein [Bacteroidota bacterium]